MSLENIENLFYSFSINQSTYYKGCEIMAKRATIHDVAGRAGVSITTVSRVINDNYPVSEKTKKKVNEAVEALGFRPNLLARSLIQDKTHTIGIITPSIENLFFSEVISGIDSFLSGLDYRTFLCSTAANPETEKEMIDSLLNRSVDGIIVVDPRTKNIKSGFYEGVSQRLPLVLVNGYSKGIRCNYVSNDDVIGTMEALEYFKKEGHEEIFLLRGHVSYSYDIKEEMFKDFMAESGLEVNESSILRIKSGNELETVKQAREIVEDAINRGIKMSAILCCNDYMAVGALNAARAKGKNVPEDISIIGFDNTLISQITEPSLSTVDHHMIELGSTAAERMAQLIEGKDESLKKISVSTNLIVRKS